jgi:hypothetical protein
VNEEMHRSDAREVATADSKAKTHPILTIANGARKSYGCRSKMLNDSGSNRECPYPHDEKSLVQAHRELQERLDKSPYNSKRQSKIALVTKTHPVQDDDDGFEDLCCATFGESKPEYTFAVTFVVLCTLQKQTRAIYIARNLFHGVCKGITWALRCFQVSGFRVRALRAPTL